MSDFNSARLRSIDVFQNAVIDPHGIEERLSGYAFGGLSPVCLTYPFKADLSVSPAGNGNLATSGHSPRHAYQAATYSNYFVPLNWIGTFGRNEILNSRLTLDC